MVLLGAELHRNLFSNLLMFLYSLGKQNKLYVRHGPRFNYPENKKINWIIGDIMDAQQYKDKINQSDTIIHTVATLIDTSITKFRSPGAIGTYQHMNRDTFLTLLKTLNSPKKIIYISAEGHPPFVPRYQITKKESEQALFNSEHQGYAIRPGFIYDANLKKWSIPLRHTIKLWNKLYPYIPLNIPHSLVGSAWAQFKQSQPTSLNKLADTILYLCKNGNEDKILDDSKILELSEKYQKSEKL